MAAKQTGKRMAPLRQRRKKAAPRSAGKGNAALEREQQQMVQLLISGSLFVLLVAIKLLLPERVVQLGEPISKALESNMNVTNVFSAIGRAFSGEDTVQDSLGNVYQAVFQPQAALENIPADGGEEILGTAQVYPRVPSPLENQQLDPSVIYSGENLPENAELQQVVLGFDYCPPVTGKVTSEFGFRKGADDDGRFHYGVDLISNSGTAIQAFADGIVSVVGDSSSYGKYLMIQHPDGYSTLYAHCSDIHVSSGQKVTRGEKVAEMGDTGQATGVHLHFELQRNGVYLNPVYYVV